MACFEPDPHIAAGIPPPVAMRYTLPALALWLICSACSLDSDPVVPAMAVQNLDAPPTSSAAQMTASAAAFLDALSEEERRTVLFALEDNESRVQWSNLPSAMFERTGLRMGDLSDAQRRALHALLRASTSSQGYHKIAGIIWIDDVLSAEAQARAGNSERMARLIESWDSENYWVALFGNPRTDARWGWLLNGHHLAASFTVVDDQVAFTPLFLGAEPYEINTGPYAGFRALSHEVERGFELVQSLTSVQSSQAVLSDEVPQDVLEGPGRKASLEQFEGITAAALDAEQQRLLHHLIAEYVNNADHDAAAAHLAEIERDGLDALYFAWMGPTNDITKRYYYRVHGPSILIEYVRERGVGGSGANHIHSIVRDPGNDYGEDWLQMHYEEHHAGPGPRR